MIPSAQRRWFDLGLQLLDPKYENELNAIEDDTKTAATCCRKMFSKWLNTDELASWDKLIKALRIVQLNSVASGIEQLLLQGEYVTDMIIISVVVIVGGAHYIVCTDHTMMSFFVDTCEANHLIVASI